MLGLLLPQVLQLRVLAGVLRSIGNPNKPIPVVEPQSILLLLVLA